jgi:hypothetical protein
MSDWAIRIPHRGRDDSLVDEGEEAREAARAESRRRQLEAQVADREVDAATARKHKLPREEEVRRLVPPGVPA